MSACDENELLASLGSADPIRGARVDAVGASLLMGSITSDELPVRTSTRDVSRLLRRLHRRRRRWLPIAVGTLGAALLMGGLAPAAASWMFQAQTGVVDSSGGSEAVKGAEWIDSSESDFESYMESIYPRWLPLPSGVDQSRFAAQEANRYADVTGEALVQDVTLQFTYEMAAQCLWRDEYLRAVGAGDSARATAALDVLDDAASWPAIVASDGGGVSDSLREMASRARAGDPEPLARWNMCPTEWTLAALGVAP